MRVSSRADYGVRALFELGRHYGRGPLQSREIAQRQRIPEAYLHQVMSSLSKAGLVRSTRGPSGGHELARPPDQVSLIEVMLLLDGVDQKAHPHQAGHPQDVIHMLWHDLLQQSFDFLSAQSIQDILDRDRTTPQVATYSI